MGGGVTYTKVTCLDPELFSGGGGGGGGGGEAPPDLCGSNLGGSSRCDS